MTEHQHQTALFQWIDLMTPMYPELGYAYAIPNGGLRNKKVAYKLKREGVKPGVPDICLPYPVGGSQGLYIELKTPTGKTTEHQRRWISFLESQGYVAAVCYGWESAKTLIEAYIGITQE